MSVIHPTLPSDHAVHDKGMLQGLLGLLVRIIQVVLAMLFVLPVLLLFAGTGVPWYVTVALLGVDGALIWWWWRGAAIAGGSLLYFVGLCAVAIFAVLLSQRFAYTPPITDAKGVPLPKSIASMERVVLGGSEQWITIRGHDVDNPVLLYLGIGGPGAGGMPANRLALNKLEEHFVVVNWDQPGTGKSYGAVPISALTVARFVDDAYELAQLMRTRFGEEKIYVLGLSWGTIVGIQLVQAHPELFHAYVGNGQMVNTTENDRIGYDFAVAYAEAHNGLATVNRLRRNGPPPYSGAGMATKYMAYNDVLFRYMNSPTIPLILLLVPQFAPEYGLVDRVNFARGLTDGFPVVYPQLRDLDFIEQARELQVPVFFMVGRDDINAVAALVERYYNALEAPYKELVWLEGGHGATPEQFADVFVNRVLPHIRGQAE